MLDRLTSDEDEIKSELGRYRVVSASSQQFTGATGRICELRGSVPEAPPTNPPNPQKTNGINQGYKLQAWVDSNFTEATEYKSMTVPPSLFDPLAEQNAIMTVTVPEEVENLQFKDISDRALTVKWSPPKETNGILTHYQLKYMIKDIPDSLRVENFTADMLLTKVEHLQALTHYKFQVTAWTLVGSGKPKVATIQSGVEPVLPEPPTKLALSNMDAFSIVLQFTPGFDGNSSIIKWTVQVGQFTVNAPFVKVEDYHLLHFSYIIKFRSSTNSAC
ncbi:PREDICTED: protein sidekick-like, partial [Vollenhovia emeryi]|uniref:protein sidekick-like n=1 Tax=Vollenhovia emeryi TaxID=411798 RepID=UPI0005F3DCB1